MSCIWRAALIVISLSGYATGSKCPPEEDLKPYCWCLNSFTGGGLYCKGLNSPSEIVPPIEACQGYNVTTLMIFNSTLLYFPRDVFRGTIFEKIALFNTVLMSLSNGPLAFEGLEDTMVELRASRTDYITQWRISQMRELKKMDTIDINNIHLEAVDEEFPVFPLLTVIGLSHAGISYLGDEAFAQCKNIMIVGLSHNYLSDMKRSMFPKPAPALNRLDLSNNEISTFPEDFFSEMPSLTKVNLANNQFTTLPEGIFRRIMRQVNTLDLTGNALMCDCRIKWIVEKNLYPANFYAWCDYPPSIKGEAIRLLAPGHLFC